MELKASPRIEPTHIAQTISYLGVTAAELGLIMNFGAQSMEYKRLPNYANQRKRQQPQAPQPPPNVQFPELTNQVLQALFEVRTELGSGFLHQVYRRASRIEFGLRKINHEYITELPLRFEKHRIGTRPVRLFSVESKMLVATLALKQILPAHIEKLRWAMQELNCQLGLMANFYPSELGIHFIRG